MLLNIMNLECVGRDVRSQLPAWLWSFCLLFYRELKFIGHQSKVQAGVRLSLTLSYSSVYKDKTHTFKDSLLCVCQRANEGIVCMFVTVGDWRRGCEDVKPAFKANRLVTFLHCKSAAFPFRWLKAAIIINLLVTMTHITVYKRTLVHSYKL